MQKKTTRFITPKDRLKLSDWARANWQRFEGLSDANMAAVASNELGFEIVGSSVKGVCDAADIKRRKARHGTPIPMDDVKRDADFQAICRELADLQKSLGITSSVQFEALLDSFK